MATDTETVRLLRRAYRRRWGRTWPWDDSYLLEICSRCTDLDDAVQNMSDVDPDW